MEPGIRRGEIVFVKRQEDVLDGQIAVVIIDRRGDAQAGITPWRRACSWSATIRRMSPMLFDARNSDVIRILGRAVSVSREL